MQLFNTMIQSSGHDTDLSSYFASLDFKATKIIVQSPFCFPDTGSGIF